MKENPFLGLDAYFVADAVGPSGKFKAAESEHMKKFVELNLERDLARVHQSFVDQLVESGWIPEPDRGQHWWQLRFRKD